MKVNIKMKRLYKNEQLNFKKMRMKIFTFLSKIDAAFKT